MKFSVLMTTYIGEIPENLDMSLKSIMIEQTIKPDQVVLVYDGPVTNELNEVAERYNKMYPDVLEIIRCEANQGQSKASKEGFKYLRNEWFARMDSDDISVFDRFEKQIFIIEQHPELQVIGGWIEEFKNSIGDLNSYRVVPEWHDEIVASFKNRMPINNVTAMIKKSAVEAAGGYGRDTVNEDYSLYAHMWVAGSTFYNIQDVLVNVRIGNGMVSRRGGFKLYRDWRKDQFFLFANHKQSLLATFISCIKCFIFICSPTWLKNLFYKFFLRKKNK